MMQRRSVSAAVVASIALLGSISLAGPPVDGAGPAPPIPVTLVPAADYETRHKLFGPIGVRFVDGEMRGLIVHMDADSGTFWKQIGVIEGDVLLSVRTRGPDGVEQITREPAGALLDRIQQGSRMRLEIETRASRTVPFLDLDVLVAETPDKT